MRYYLSDKSYSETCFIILFQQGSICEFFKMKAYIHIKRKNVVNNSAIIVEFQEGSNPQTIIEKSYSRSICCTKNCRLYPVADPKISQRGASSGFLKIFLKARQTIPIFPKKFIIF